MTQHVNRGESLEGAPWLVRFPVRTPTLPPATHTNTYVIGERTLVVVDPASPWSDEQQELARYLDERAAAGARVALIVLTHHHVDHVSGAAALAAHLGGVPVAAHAETRARVVGRVAVDRLVDEGDRIADGDVPLDVLFTPGHAPGHVCLEDVRSGAVVAGDMVASVGTIIIDPPDGDMRLYLESLERLRRHRARWLLPAHGAPVAQADALLGFYLAHRREREGRVVAALEERALPVEELVPRAYPDVAPAFHGLAARSLLAHLLKLRDDGRAVEEGEGGGWRRA